MYYSRKNNNKTEPPTTPLHPPLNPLAPWRRPPGGRVRHWDVLSRYRAKSSRSIVQQSVREESNESCEREREKNRRRVATGRRRRPRNRGK